MARRIGAAAVVLGLLSFPVFAADTATVSVLLDKPVLTPQEQAQLAQGLDALMNSDVSNADLLSLIQRAGKKQFLTDADKALLRPKLADRLGGAADKLAKLTVPLVREATVALDYLGGAAEKAGLVKAWMDSGEAWKAAGPEPLTRFLWALQAGKPDAVRFNEAALTGHVWTSYLVSDAEPAKATPTEYVELAIQFHTLVTPEQAKDLGKNMVARLTDPETAGKLSLADLMKVRQTLGDLPNQLDVADVVAAWIKNCKTYETLGPADIGYLCDRLRPKQGEATPKAAIEALVASVRARKLLADPAAIIAADAGQWPAMARALRNYITEAERFAIIEMVRSLFLGESEHTAKLNSAQVADLVEMSAYYGRADLAGQALLTWLAANDISKLPADQLALLSGALAQAEAFGKAGKPLWNLSPEALAKKVPLGEIAWDGYLSKADFLSQTPLLELTGFARSVGAFLLPEQKGQTAGRLLARFAADGAALSKLSVAEAISLAEAIRALHKAKEAGDMVLGWISACDTWRQAGPYDLQAMAGILRGGAGDAPAQAVQFALRAFNDELSKLKAQQKPEVFALVRLAQFMKQMGLIGKDKGFPEFATSLVGAVEGGATVRLRPDGYYLGLPLATPECRAILGKAAAGANGQPSRDAARVAAWAFYHSGATDNWVNQVDQAIAGASGDNRARWILAKFDTLMISPLSWEARAKLLDDALAAAQSTAAKLEAIRETVWCYAEGGKHKEAAASLDRFAARFTDPAFQAAFDQLRKEIRAKQQRDAQDDIGTLMKRVTILETQAREAQAQGNLKQRDVLLRFAERYRREAEALRDQPATQPG